MKHTKKQHFIPRSILRHHICMCIPAPPNHIFQYNKDTGTEHLTGIENICCVNYLYEIKDANGSINIYHLNKIEKHLLEIEGKFAFAIKNIEHNRISDSDINVIRFYIAIQMLRVTNILELAKNLAQEVFSFDTNTAENFTKATSLLPGVIKRDQNILFNAVLKMVCSKYLKIYCSHIPLCLNESYPVLPVVGVPFADYSENVSYIFLISYDKCIALLLADSFEGELVVRIPDTYAKYLNSLAYMANGKYLYCSVSVKDNMDMLLLKLKKQ